MSTNPQGKRVAIITGGGRGLGKSETLAIAAKGIHCILTYNGKREDAEEVADAARALGVEARVLQLDLADVPSFDAFASGVRSILGEFGVERFDYLVNNGGISHRSPFADIKEEDVDRLFAINFKGVLFLTQKLLPLINDGGRIVNTSSGSTRFVFVPEMLAYSSIKGALEPYTRYLAQELGPRGISVNTLAPGPIGTDFSGGMIRDNPQYRENISKATAFGRPGDPEDVGPMVASLLGDENPWIAFCTVARGACTAAGVARGRRRSSRPAATALRSRRPCLPNRGSSPSKSTS